MPVPTEQVMQLIADNQAMIDKLKNQLKTEQDACAHTRLVQRTNKRERDKQESSRSKRKKSMNMLQSSRSKRKKTVTNH
jgi:hypothetical protein